MFRESLPSCFLDALLLYYMMNISHSIGNA